MDVVGEGKKKGLVFQIGNQIEMKSQEGKSLFNRMAVENLERKLETSVNSSFFLER